jgi:hypothetical protein
MDAACPICGPYDVNCRCTAREQDQYEEIQRLRLTDDQIEAILFCVSCAQDYRDTTDGNEERATQMIQTAMRLAIQNVGPAPVEGPRTASVTDVGGAGPTITDEEREALEVAVEYVGSAYAVERHAATLRGLLERTK